MCLDWLAGQELSNLSVLDWGCGSGVLAIAAIALGAKSVTALDIDRQAIQATLENAQRNGCSNRLRVHHPEELPKDQTFDVVVANILAGSLIELAPSLARHCRPGARVVLSGILASQAQPVRTACVPWLDLHLAVTRDDWVLLEGVPVTPANKVIAPKT
jgi:ribosomal protein L11 methyltransferase